MKLTNFMLKVAALILTAAAITCCILANLEKISDGLVCLRNRIAEKRNSFLGNCDHFAGYDEDEDWAD